MSGADAPRRFVYVLSCPCGARLTGDSEDELVDTVFEHLRARHPDRAGEYEREHILLMAQRLVAS